MKLKSLALILTLALSRLSVAGTVTISGISSGGFMASQMATIYSDQIQGVATVAGGVYYCAQNHFQEKLAQYGSAAYFAFGVTENGVLRGLDPWNLANRQNKDQPLEPMEINPIYEAVGICMGHPEQALGGEKGPMNLDFMKSLEVSGSIASTKHISKQRVLIFQGKNDDVVRPVMAEKLREFYSRMGVPDTSLKMIAGDGNHNFPTNRIDGIACDEERVPYVANCGQDLAGEILRHTLGRSLKRVPADLNRLQKVQQVDAPQSVAAYGYFYTSDFCLKKPESCDLHVALHGCKMSDDYDESFQKLYESRMQLSHILNVQPYELAVRIPKKGARAFAQKAGYIEYAESDANRLMVYFPQTRISVDNYPANPKGCWDWYGWTGAEYATNRGAETAWLMKQIQLLQKNPNDLLLKK